MDMEKKHIALINLKKSETLKPSWNPSWFICSIKFGCYTRNLSEVEARKKSCYVSWYLDVFLVLSFPSAFPILTRNPSSSMLSRHASTLQTLDTSFSFSPVWCDDFVNINPSVCLTSEIVWLLHLGTMHKGSSVLYLDTFVWRWMLAQGGMGK